MARPSITDRLPEVVDAAVQVFSQKGYENAQMADIAARLGMRAGALYNYVESKQGLFALCLERLMREEAVTHGGRDLPVPGRSLDLTLRDLRAHARRSLRLPRLTLALEGPVPAEPEAELAEVVEELYDLIGGTRQLADMIERSAGDTPELAALFYDEWRAPLLGRLEAYLRARTEAGAFRGIDDVGVGARFVVETVVWFARHRFHDVGGWKLDQGRTERVVADLIVHALLPRESPR